MVDTHGNKRSTEGLVGKRTKVLIVKCEGGAFILGKVWKRNIEVYGAKGGQHRRDIEK